MLVERALDALDANPTPIQQARRKTAYRLALGERGEEFLLKVNADAALPVWRRLRGSRALAALACAEQLAQRGVAAVVPLAVGERRRGGLRETSYELVPWLADAVDLARMRTERLGSAADRRRVARTVGSLVRALHDAGVHQDDLAPNNFLWRPGAEPEVLALDFERAQLRGVVPDADRRRALAKLDRYCAGASAASRMRFLAAYAGGNRRERHALWRELESESVALLRHDVARWTRIARAPGRRFERLGDPAASPHGRGLVRRGVDARAVGAALAGDAASAWLCFECDAPRDGDSARRFGVALALHQRGLALQPDGYAARDGRVRIAFAPGDARPLGAARVSLPALAIFLDRLLALGALIEVDLARRLAVSDATDRVWLLDPSAFRPSVEPRRERRRARARALAEPIWREAQLSGLR